MLTVAFLSWMFAGLNISLFILIHRQMSLELLGNDVPEKLITQWFAWYQAAFLLGAATGGWIFGWIGDRWGRTRSLALSVLCVTGFTGGCYLVHDAPLMLLFRFFACMGIGGVWPNAVALVAEAWPSGSRPMLAGLLGTAANVGFVLLGFIGYYYPITQEAWRWTLILGASPVVLGLFIWFVVPESARWLAQREQKQTIVDDRSPLAEVLTPPLLQRTILGILLGAVPTIGSAANANWLVPWTDQVNQQVATTSSTESNASTEGRPALPTIKKPDARQKAKTQIMRSSGAAVGSLLGGMMASWLGRRLSYFLISLGSIGMSTFIFSQLDPRHPYFPWATIVFGFVSTTYFGWLPLFLPELFPTRVRSTGTGISFNTGRIASAIVVLSAGVLVSQFGGDYSRVGLWTGLIYAVGMVIIWWVPKDQDTRLQD